MSRRMVDLLPSSLTGDPGMLAAAEMLDQEFDRVDALIPFAAPWQCLDKQTEPMLSFMAAGCAVDVWEPTWSDEKKREVLRGAKRLHRKKGTAQAVKDGLESMGFRARHINWPEYGGDPFKFKVEVGVLDQPVTDAVKASVNQSITNNKAGRSHPDQVDVHFRTEGALEIGGGFTFGRVVEILPYKEEYVDPVGEVALGGAVAFYRTVNIGAYDGGE